jgi:hypothetical protein
VAVEHGINLKMSRGQPGEMLGAWLLVRVWNRGGRPVIVERIGLPDYYEADLRRQPWRAAGARSRNAAWLSARRTGRRLAEPTY